MRPLPPCLRFQAIWSPTRPADWPKPFLYPVPRRSFAAPPCARGHGFDSQHRAVCGADVRAESVSRGILSIFRHGKE